MPPPQEQFVDLHFPLAGVDLSQSFDQQPNRPLPSGSGYARTTALGVNVVAYDPTTGRARGGSRPGMKKYGFNLVNPVNPPNSIQELNFITISPSQAAAGGGGAITYTDILTVSGNWSKNTVPGSTIIVQCIGGGGGGCDSTDDDVGVGGGGGAYAAKTVAYTPNASIPFVIGAGGFGGSNAGWTEGSGQAGGDTSWNGGVVLAKGGTPGINNGVLPPTPGTGGAAGSCVGTTVFSGGNGGSDGGNHDCGSGGGGAAGPNGAGFNAGVGGGSTTPSGGHVQGGSGGGGAGGSTGTNGFGVSLVGPAPAPDQGYWGGAAWDGTPGGASPGGNGVFGSGGAGGTALFVSIQSLLNGGKGGNGREFSAAAGAGGGGGGGGSNYGYIPTPLVGNGGNGGLYGGGGGGSGWPYVAAIPLGGNGGQGVIAVTYQLAGGGGTDPGLGPVGVLVSVSGGTVTTLTPAGWQTVTNGATALSTTVSVIRSAVVDQYMYFVDGANWKRYNPQTNAMEAWVATSGTLPVGPTGLLPLLIAAWRGCIMLAGWPDDPQNWFISAVGDPTNWNAFPVPITPTQAIFGTDSPMGVVGDVITALVPYSDDLLIVGGYHTIWAFTGDPRAGGSIDNVSNTIGMAWGTPWERDPYGSLYFVSNLMGIYVMQPGSGNEPQRISQPIEQLLAAQNITNIIFRLVWDDSMQGLHVFATDHTSSSTACTHFFWEQRTGGWFVKEFANANMNPKCVLKWQGNTAADRVALIGSWDGFVRSLDMTAVNDDGTAIASQVLIGPINSPDFDDIMLKDLQGVLGANSGNVTYSVLAGETAEIAINNSASITGTWAAGRNPSSYVRVAGHALYVLLSAAASWSMEAIKCRIVNLGKVRRRGPY